MELYHYGILGQKWGVRRYQNPDGTYTAEGRRRRLSEIRSENKKAFELGRKATIYGRATKIGMNKLIKTENKINKLTKKNPQDSSKKRKKLEYQWLTQAKTTVKLSDEYKRALKEAEEHCESLIKKYGKENIKPISYKKESNARLGEYQLINERVASGKEIVSSLLVSFGSALLPLPMSVVVTPATKNELGYALYDEEYRRNPRMK